MGRYVAKSKNMEIARSFCELKNSKACRRGRKTEKGVGER